MEIVSADDPTLSDAMGALSAMEAEDSPAPETPEATPTPDSVTPEEQPAPAPAEVDVPEKPDAVEPGAPATEESPDKDKQSTEQPKPEGSRYEKNRTRLEGGWQKLNEEKATTRATAEALKRDRDILDRERADFVRKQAAANKPKFAPEDYERHSLTLEGRAATLEREAKKLEEDGKFEAAEARKEEAIADKVNAKKAREYAGQLRANPPQADPTEAQVNEKFKADQKQWWTKAAIDFPAAAKGGTPEAEAIKGALTPGHPQFNPVAARFVEAYPEGLYYLTELVSAKSSAARVPTMETELGQLRAKVKELSEKLAPNIEAAHGRTNAGTPEFSQMNEDQQFAELERMAQSMSR